MTSNTKDVSVLNTLIATLLDSIDGYQKSAADIDNQVLADKFNARARERQSSVATLQAAVAASGGKPEDDGTLLGGAQRMFQSLKEAVVTQDDKAIVAEVERGEDYLEGKFETALAEVGLSPAARAAAEEAWQSVRSGHDEMSALKHSMGAGSVGAGPRPAPAAHSRIGAENCQKPMKLRPAWSKPNPRAEGSFAGRGRPRARERAYGGQTHGPGDAVLTLGVFFGMNKSYYPVLFGVLGYDAFEDGYVVTINRRMLEGGPS